MEVLTDVSTDKYKNDVTPQMTTDTEILTNLQKYYNIVKGHAYNLSNNEAVRNRQLSTLRVKQEAWSNDALQFIYSCYIKDKYFDELDMFATGGEVLTECKYVVNIVFPGYLNSLTDIMEIMLDFDNMLALSPTNYVKWKQRTLELNDEQKRLIEHKERLIINRYKLQLTDVIFYRATLANSTKVQRSIKEICADIEKYLLDVEKSTKKMEKNKPVEAWDVDTKQLFKVFESAKEASESLQVSRSEISKICQKKHAATKSPDGKLYTFRFVGDSRPLSFSSYTYKRRPKKVLVFDEQGKIMLHTYNSISEAAKKLHIAKKTLCCALAHSGVIMSNGTLYKVSLELTND